MDSNDKVKTEPTSASSSASNLNSFKPPKAAKIEPAQVIKLPHDDKRTAFEDMCRNLCPDLYLPYKELMLLSVEQRMNLLQRLNGLPYKGRTFNFYMRYTKLARSLKAAVPSQAVNQIMQVMGKSAKKALKGLPKMAPVVVKEEIFPASSSSNDSSNVISAAECVATTCTKEKHRLGKRKIDVISKENKKSKQNRLKTEEAAPIPEDPTHPSSSRADIANRVFAKLAQLANVNNNGIKEPYSYGNIDPMRFVGPQNYTLNSVAGCDEVIANRSPSTVDDFLELVDVVMLCRMRSNPVIRERFQHSSCYAILSKLCKIIGSKYNLKEAAVVKGVISPPSVTVSTWIEGLSPVVTFGQGTHTELLLATEWAYASTLASFAFLLVIPYEMISIIRAHGLIYIDAILYSCRERIVELIAVLNEQQFHPLKNSKGTDNSKVITDLHCRFIHRMRQTGREYWSKRSIIRIPSEFALPPAMIPVLEQVSRSKGCDDVIDVTITPYFSFVYSDVPADWGIFNHADKLVVNMDNSLLSCTSQFGLSPGDFNLVPKIWGPPNADRRPFEINMKDAVFNTYKPMFDSTVALPCRDLLWMDEFGIENSLNILRGIGYRWGRPLIVCNYVELVSFGKCQVWKHSVRLSFNGIPYFFLGATGKHTNFHAAFHQSASSIFGQLSAMMIIPKELCLYFELNDMRWLDIVLHVCRARFACFESLIRNVQFAPLANIIPNLCLTHPMFPLAETFFWRMRHTGYRFWGVGNVLPVPLSFSLPVERIACRHFEFVPSSDSVDWRAMNSMDQVDIFNTIELLAADRIMAPWERLSTSIRLQMPDGSIVRHPITIDFLQIRFFALQSFPSDAFLAPLVSPGVLNVPNGIPPPSCLISSSNSVIMPLADTALSQIPIMPPGPCYYPPPAIPFPTMYPPAMTQAPPFETRISSSSPPLSLQEKQNRFRLILDIELERTAESIADSQAEMAERIVRGLAGSLNYQLFYQLSGSRKKVCTLAFAGPFAKILNTEQFAENVELAHRKAFFAMYKTLLKMAVVPPGLCEFIYNDERRFPYALRVVQQCLERMLKYLRDYNLKDAKSKLIKKSRQLNCHDWCDKRIIMLPSQQMISSEEKAIFDCFQCQRMTSAEHNEFINLLGRNWPILAPLVDPAAKDPKNRIESGIKINGSLLRRGTALSEQFVVEKATTSLGEGGSRQDDEIEEGELHDDEEDEEGRNSRSFEKSNVSSSIPAPSVVVKTEPIDETSGSGLLSNANHNEIFLSEDRKPLDLSAYAPVSP